MTNAAPAVAGPSIASQSVEHLPMDALSLFPASVTYAWLRAAAALGEPEVVLGLDDREFAELIALLREQRALPLYLRALSSSPGWSEIEGERRTQLDQWLARYRTIADLAGDEVVEVVSALVAEGLRPVLLKGAALARRVFDEPYLRPFGDIDVFFSDRAEAERAHALLREAGYAPLEQTRGGDPWLWSRHLPQQRNPERILDVECHGGLIFPPRDRRHRRELALLQDLDRLDLGPCCAFALCAEAAIVHGFAHAFVRHGDEPHALSVLLDGDAVIRKQGARFRWDALTGLASESDFAAATAMGLAACLSVLGTPIPNAVMAWCRATLASTGVHPPSGDPQPRRSAGHLSGFVHADSLGGALSMLFHSTFPAPAFMRFRYPTKARWPLPLLYPYRWTVQAGKTMSLMRAPSSPDTPARAGERGD
jgi:Uncharacterised nucleotidyltransferase